MFIIQQIKRKRLTWDMISKMTLGVSPLETPMCWTVLGNNSVSYVSSTTPHHTTPHRCARAVQVSLTHMLADCLDSTHRSGWTWRVSWIRATWSCSPPGVWSSGSSSRTRSGPWGGLPPAGGTGGPRRPPSLWEQRSREDKSLRSTHWAWNFTPALLPHPWPALIWKTHATQATETSPVSHTGSDVWARMILRSLICYNTSFSLPRIFAFVCMTFWLLA